MPSNDQSPGPRAPGFTFDRAAQRRSWMRDRSLRDARYATREDESLRAAARHVYDDIYLDLSDTSGEVRFHADLVGLGDDDIKDQRRRLRLRAEMDPEFSLWLIERLKAVQSEINRREGK